MIATSRFSIEVTWLVVQTTFSCFNSLFRHDEFSFFGFDESPTNKHHLFVVPTAVVVYSCLATVLLLIYSCY